MSQESRSLLNLITPDRVDTDKFGQLVGEAIDTLLSLLKSDALSASERAKIALKILEMAGSSGAIVHAASEASSGSIVQAPEGLASNGASVLSSQPSPLFLPASYVKIDDFLSAEENGEALNIALSNQNKFVASTTTTNAENYRQSSVLYATLFPEFYELLKKKILKTVPSVIAQLKMSDFLISKVEMQLTAHNDGCFYKVHNDSGSEATATRELTYVYYFCQEPPKFSEGALRLYDTELTEGTATQYPTFKDIEPRNNRIVFFNSRCKHEVLPVRCPSQKFKDSRFTLNGWIRRVEV